MALGSEFDRRRFLAVAAGAAAWLWAPRGSAQPAAGKAARPGVPPDTRELLDEGGFVYISPLRADGSESTCHGEVWFGWIDGGVVINTRPAAWKAKALRERGLDRARIWVGNHGRWKSGLTGRNEAFRAAPHFDARATLVTDRAVLDRLLALYETKYVGEFDRWREDMRDGFFSGDRLLIRYEPI